MVAFAMLNRGSQWVAESDLDADLRTLFTWPAPAAKTQDHRAPLRAAERVLGRFFFVHRARAFRDEARLETYEFLHATFGEFLVARLAWKALLDIAAREAASTMSLGAAPVDDDLLHALLSFAVLSARAPIISFSREMAAQLDDHDREALVELLVRLFRAVHQQRSGRGYADYQPQPLPVPRRHATYSANLMLLTVCVATSIRASEVYGTHADTMTAWHSQALLWRSQLSAEEWTSLVETFAVDRVWDGDRRDIRLALDDGSFQVPTIDLYWTYDQSPEGPERRFYAFSRTDQHPGALLRRAHFQCGIDDDVTLHALEPLAITLGPAVNLFLSKWERECPSAAHALLDVWLLPLRNPTAEERRTAYERCVEIARIGFPNAGEDPTQQYRYAVLPLLLDRLATDVAAPAALATEVLTSLVHSVNVERFRHVASSLIRCALTFLGRDRDCDLRIAEVLATVLLPDFRLVDDVLVLDALVRAAELDLPLPTLAQLNEGELQERVQAIAGRRPDLVERVRRLTNKPDSSA